MQKNNRVVKRQRELQHERNQIRNVRNTVDEQEIRPHVYRHRRAENEDKHDEFEISLRREQHNQKNDHDDCDSKLHYALFSFKFCVV